MMEIKSFGLWLLWIILAVFISQKTRMRFGLNQKLSLLQNKKMEIARFFLQVGNLFLNSNRPVSLIQTAGSISGV